MSRRRRPPKPYAFHSRKARFKVYCNSTGQQGALLQHILQTECKESLCCVIVCPVLTADGQQDPSASAQRPRRSPLAPVLHYLESLRRSKGTSGSSSDDSDESSEQSSSDHSSNNSSSDESGDDSSSDDDGDAEEKHTEEKHKEGESKDRYPYHVFLEYRTAHGRSSQQWGLAIFEGFDKAQQLATSTPLSQCTSKYMDEKDSYIADLLIQHHTATLNKSQPAPAVYGTPSLDEHSTLHLVCCKYSARADQDKVMADIRLYCRGRSATESTFDRIKKHWRRAHEIPTTPRVFRIPDAVEEPPRHPHPFFQHKELDGWALRFIGPGKSLNRLEYKPLVLWSKKGRIGKTEWAKSLGRHIHIRGSLDPEKIHAGIMQGADVLILDNIKWHVLFGSDLGRALAEGQDSVTWLRRDGERVTTKLTVPVIILNNKKCNTWGPNNKKYWRQNLQWVRVRRCLFDKSKTINRDPLSAVLPPVPPSSSPLPPATSPPAVDGISPPSPARSSSVSSSSQLAPPPVPSSLDSIPAELLPILPRTLDIRSRFPDAISFGQNNGSWYISSFLTKEEADSMLATIGPELEPLYVRRDDPTVQVPMFTQKRGVSRDKAAVSDAAGSLRLLYRYGAPELAQTLPFSKAPTVLRGRELILARLGVRSTHCISNRYKKQKGRKGEKRDGIGSHQDKDRDFPVGGPIMTLTLSEPGGERTLEVTQSLWQHTGETVTKFNRKKQEWQVVPVKTCMHTETFMMAHGSLTLIDWNTNHMWGKKEKGRVWKHEVKQVSGECAERFGLTYRCIGTVWDISTGEIVNVKGKHEQAVPLVIVDKEGEIVPRDQGNDPRWSMSLKSTTEDLVDVAADDDGVDDEGVEDEADDNEEEPQVVEDNSSNISTKKRRQRRKATTQPKKRVKKSDDAENVWGEGEDRESSDEEQPKQKRSKRKCKDKSKGKGKRERKVAEFDSDEEDA